MRSFTFQVPESGILPDGARLTCANAIKELAGKVIRIVISEKKEQRSAQQNAYWFAALDRYVVPVFRDTGSNWSNYKIHKWVMHELGYEEAMTLPDGKVVASRIESSKFDVKAWEEFMERARAYLATEYNIFVPLPNEEL